MRPVLAGLADAERLTEVALAALGADFAEHGAAVIEEVRKTKPHRYLRVVASLLPRQVQMEKLNPFSDLTDEELEQLEAYLRASTLSPCTRSTATP